MGTRRTVFSALMTKAPPRGIFCLLLVGCSSILGDSDEDVRCDGVVADPAQFVELTLTGDLSFQGPHAGQNVTITTSCTSGDGFLASGGGSHGPIFDPSQTVSFGFGRSRISRILRHGSTKSHDIPDCSCFNRILRYSPAKSYGFPDCYYFR